MKSWLEGNGVEIYLTHNKGKSVVPKKIIEALKITNYKYVTSVLKNMYIDKLTDIVNKYSNTFYNTIKMKPIDVRSRTYIDLVYKIVKKPLYLS